MAARRPAGYRPGYSRWDRREIGLKPENALSRVARKSLPIVFITTSRPFLDSLSYRTRSLTNPELFSMFDKQS